MSNDLTFSFPMSWFWCGAGILGVAGFFFGLGTALWPRHSIAFYQWIMKRLNWRVSPIDEAHEIRMTRCFGILLILLNLALLSFPVLKLISR